MSSPQAFPRTSRRHNNVFHLITIFLLMWYLLRKDKTWHQLYIVSNYIHWSLNNVGFIFNQVTCNQKTLVALILKYVVRWAIGRYLEYMVHAIRLVLHWNSLVTSRAFWGCHFNPMYPFFFFFFFPILSIMGFWVSLS